MGCYTASPRTSACPDGVDPTLPSLPGWSLSASTRRGIAAVQAQNVSPESLRQSTRPCTPGVGTPEVRTRAGRSPPPGWPSAGPHSRAGVAGPTQTLWVNPVFCFHRGGRSVKPTHRSRAHATPTAKRWMPMRFRPDPLSNPQAGTAVAVAEVHHGMFRPHVQSAHQALQGRV
jgi:hypothetical protein